MWFSGKVQQQYSSGFAARKATTKNILSSSSSLYQIVKNSQVGQANRDSSTKLIRVGHRSFSYQVTTGVLRTGYEFPIATPAVPLSLEEGCCQKRCRSDKKYLRRTHLLQMLPRVSSPSHCV
ncbi:hypothetical protein CIHG_07468 [Coccidioides immitis H538.4]|uniref:Uncharacterized protein n=3 Tax=Coccidioides immitis TaxID=5501 RepID=A0A0J8RAL5_COCIT|nr:hypothetical protein CIRG_02394 [Coccidioides immitis RMSCC 2394]KMU80913.1 hypothetical protein CISG_08809 [Coccidioides immitis RMSCC 3703]KMU89661.1 hypothetical protein CIHG_07468 [Coccidioides immitis H538.4]